MKYLKNKTNLIIFLNVVLFLLEFILPTRLVDSLVFHGDDNFRPWQLITYQYLHSGLLHIFLNMFVFYQFGNTIEIQTNNFFKERDGWRYLIMYNAIGVFAVAFHSLCYFLLDKNIGSSVGASGSVYGMLTLFCLFYPDNKVNLYFIFSIKCKWLALILLVVELAQINSNDGVGHLAHIGGMLAAFLIWKFNFKSLQY